MNLRSLARHVALLLLAAFAPGVLVAKELAPAKEAPPAVPPLELPQARINSVDVSAWPKVRVLATILDKNGRPVQLKAVKKLTIADGKDKTKPAHIAFQLGQPLEGRKDGKLLTMDKAGVGSAITFVVAGYQDDALRSGSLGRRLKEGVASAFKQVGKTDRVNVLWYGDRIFRYVGIKGMTGSLADAEEGRVHNECVKARDEALSGGAITGAGPATKDNPGPEPGTDLCGLTSEHKAIVDLLKGDNVAYEGYFPRLFNLGEPFFHYTRYCKPPKEALKGFGEFSAANLSARKTEREERKRKGEVLDFETSAFDEALALVLKDGKPEEQKAIVLISDGRDGYVKDEAVCLENPPKRCAEMTDKKQQQLCMAGVLQERRIQQQADFKVKAPFWIGLARAANVRVFAVGLGTLGRDYELERLRLLAEKTGGTYRRADREENLAGELLSTMQEVLGQVAIEYTVQNPSEDQKTLDVKLQVELDPSMIRGDVTRLETGIATATLPPKLTLREEAERAVRGVAVKLQELLGYKLYVAVGMAVLVVAALLLLLIVALVLRSIVRKVRG
jgi:hypothetical protein